MGTKLNNYVGRLIQNCDVLRRGEKRSTSGLVWWGCRCRKCGVEYETRSSQLSIGQSGHTCKSDKEQRRIDMPSAIEFVPPVKQWRRKPMTYEEIGRHEAYLYLRGVQR